MSGRNGPQTTIPMPSGLRSSVTPPCAPDERLLSGGLVDSCRPVAVARVGRLIARKRPHCD